MPPNHVHGVVKYSLSVKLNDKGYSTYRKVSTSNHYKEITAVLISQGLDRRVLGVDEGL